MFELKVALKYLLPKKKQLSVSIISLISTFVIALVVWLILVFFSVTDGLEKIWVNKMVTLTAPIRVTPTAEYYKTYYHQIDALSSSSNYETKSLGEKLASTQLDPYNPEKDEALPEGFPPNLGKDLAKEAFNAIQSVPGTDPSDYEISGASLKITLSKNLHQVSQAIYVAPFDAKNPQIHKILLTPIEKLPERGILLPKGFRDAGVAIGDKGVIGFYAPTTSSVQEQRLAVVVSGFYDPGIIPVGGKLALTNRDLVRLIRSSQAQDEAKDTQGFHVRLQNLGDVDKTKALLRRQFDERGLTPYFEIESYKEYEFTRDLIQQLSSEKNIFSLISFVIIIVACSNIISMLIILVNDKKIEIGILRSMGASSLSISTIFGLCGTIMGFIGSLIGIVAAILTLKNIDALISFISKVQGFQAFNPLFFGSELPHEISPEALRFVLIATVIISMISGLIPAYKASRLKPAEILKS